MNTSKHEEGKRVLIEQNLCFNFIQGVRGVMAVQARHLVQW